MSDAQSLALLAGITAGVIGRLYIYPAIRRAIYRRRWRKMERPIP